jgi:hypothetical protein
LNIFRDAREATIAQESGGKPPLSQMISRIAA